MNVTQITNLFKNFVDEADLAWFDNNSYLSVSMADAYNQFRALVFEFDNTIFQMSADIVFPSVTRYDLALAGNPVRILGKTPTQAAMTRLVSAVALNSQNIPFREVELFKTMQELLENSTPFVNTVTTAPNGCFLSGTVLEMGVTFQGTLRLYYVPKSLVDWTKNAPGDNEFVDDMELFHDIIALLAYQKYAIRDNAENIPQIKALQAQSLAMRKFLNQGRNFGAAGRVGQTREW